MSARFVDRVSMTIWDDFLTLTHRAETIHLKNWPHKNVSFRVFLCKILQVLVCAVWWFIRASKNCSRMFLQFMAMGVFSDRGTQFPYSMHSLSNYQPASINMHCVMNIVFADKNGHWITIPGTKPCMQFRGTFHLSHMSSGWIICRQFVQNILGLVCCHRRIAMKEVEIDTTLWRFLSCHVLKIIWHYCCVWLKRMMLCKIQTKSGFCLHRMETWKTSLNFCD